MNKHLSSGTLDSFDQGSKGKAEGEGKTAKHESNSHNLTDLERRAKVLSGIGRLAEQHRSDSLKASVRQSDFNERFLKSTEVPLAPQNLCAERHGKNWRALQ